MVGNIVNCLINKFVPADAKNYQVYTDKLSYKMQKCGKAEKSKNTKCSNFDIGQYNKASALENEKDSDKKIIQDEYFKQSIVEYFLDQEEEVNDSTFLASKLEQNFLLNIFANKLKKHEVQYITHKNIYKV